MSQALDATISGPVITALGWTLLHFVWQGAVIAAGLGIALSVMRRSAPNARYVACCAGLALMVLAGPVTFVVMLVLQPAAAALPAELVLLEATSSLARGRLAAMLPELTLVWLVGVVLFQGRLVFQWTRAQRLKLCGTLPAPASWQGFVDEFTRRLGIRPTVRIFESTLAGVPMLIGWLRPVILVPVGMATGLTPEQLRAVLAHELAHVRRHDYLVNLVQAVLESVLFYHPAVWWLSNRLRVEREYCCDDVAVSLGGNALCYAQALSLLDALRGDECQPALASTGGSLMTRIQRLLGVKTRPAARGGAWIAPLAITLTMVTAVSALALARPAEIKERQLHREHDVAFFGEGVFDDVDVVGVLQDIDAGEAELFALLRDAGMSNQELMIILKQLGPDERVANALRHAAHEGRFIKGRLHEVHEYIQQEIAAGRITEEESRHHLERAKVELHQHFEAMADRTHNRRMTADAARIRMKEIHEEVKQLLAAGEITETEAEKRLHTAADELHQGLGLQRVPEKELLKLHTEMKRFHERLDADLAVGLITEAEAADRLREIEESLLAKAHKLAEASRADHLREIHEQVKADLEAGVITEQQARERMLKAAHSMHEGGLSRLDPAQVEFIKRRMGEHIEQVKADVAAGIITEAEAKKQLHQVKLELLEGWMHRQHEDAELEFGHGSAHDHD